MKFDKFSIVSLLLCILSLATFFLEPNKYESLGYTLFSIEPVVLYFVAIPLIILSLMTGIIALRRIRKEFSNPILVYLTFAIYLIFIILASTLLRVGIGRNIYAV